MKYIALLNQIASDIIKLAIAIGHSIAVREERHS